MAADVLIVFLFYRLHRLFSISSTDLVFFQITIVASPRRGCRLPGRASAARIPIPPTLPPPSPDHHRHPANLRTPNHNRRPANPAAANHNRHPAKTKLPSNPAATLQLVTGVLCRETASVRADLGVQTTTKSHNTNRWQEE